MDEYQYLAYITPMKDNPLFSDALNLFNSGVGFMADLQKQIMQDMKERMDEKIDEMQLIRRSDLEELQTQIRSLQDEVAALKAAQK